MNRQVDNEYQQRLFAEGKEGFSSSRRWMPPARTAPSAYEDQLLNAFEAHRNASAEKREAICEELTRIADEYAAIGQAFRIAAEEDKLEIVIEESDEDEADEEATPEIGEETEE